MGSVALQVGCFVSQNWAFAKDKLTTSSPSLLLALGAVIRSLRLQKELSQSELAQKAGFKSSYVSDLELGKVNASLKQLNALASALDTQTTEIFRASEEEFQKEEYQSSTNGTSGPDADRQCEEQEQAAVDFFTDE